MRENTIFTRIEKATAYFNRFRMANSNSMESGIFLLNLIGDKIILEEVIDIYSPTTSFKEYKRGIDSCYNYEKRFHFRHNYLKIIKLKELKNIIVVAELKYTFGKEIIDFDIAKWF